MVEHPAVEVVCCSRSVRGEMWDKLCCVGQFEAALWEIYSFIDKQSFVLCEHPVSMSQFMAAYILVPELKITHVETMTDPLSYNLQL